jgi:hypothetical protein
MHGTAVTGRLGPAVSRCRARQHHGQAATLAPRAPGAGKMSQRRAGTPRFVQATGQARRARGESTGQHHRDAEARKILPGGNDVAVSMYSLNNHKRD